VNAGPGGRGFELLRTTMCFLETSFPSSTSCQVLRAFGSESLRWLLGRWKKGGSHLRSRDSVGNSVRANGCWIAYFVFYVAVKLSDLNLADAIKALVYTQLHPRPASMS